MTASLLPRAEWKAPAEDGQILIWPEPSTIFSQTDENARRLSQVSIPIQNLPLNDLRRALRRWIGHSNNGQPLIANAHQIELYHAGVWAKDVLANSLAQRTSGAAYHFAIDTDAPKHLNLRWPGASVPITDDSRLQPAAWAGLLAGPTPAHLKEIEGKYDLASADWGFPTLVTPYLQSLKRLSLESDELTWVMTNASHEMDWNLGLRHHALLASPMWDSPGYLIFAHHLLSRATEFASHYNAVLQDYRRANRSKNPGRPWPDLRVAAEECEAPFWVDDLSSGRRARAAVVLKQGSWRLNIGAREFVFDPGAEAHDTAEALGRFLAENHTRMSPRALTLTLFLRLFVCDKFIHGIGGARYDLITDAVIERFFRIDPPSFCVATATLLFPAAAGRRRIELQPLLEEGRRLRQAWKDPKKLEMVAQIEHFPRRTAQRQSLFYEMQAQLASRMKGRAYRDWQTRFESARDLQRQQADLFDREFFYALQPAERLAELIEKIEKTCGLQSAGFPRK